MSEVNIFEQATRQALRFNLRGLVSTEDLWNASLNDLNIVAVALHKQLKELEEISFIAPQPRVNTELTLKLDIVKYIIQVKLSEKEAKDASRKIAAQRAALIVLRDEKQHEALSKLTLEEIEAQLQAL